MSAPVIDSEVHVSAFLSLLSSLNPYRFGDVPGSDGNPGVLPDQYVLVDVQRSYVAQTRISGRVTRSAWAVTIRGVGRNRQEAAWRLTKAAEALEGKRVTIGGSQSTPLAFDSDQPIHRDDERHFGDVAFTYVL